MMKKLAMSASRLLAAILAASPVASGPAFGGEAEPVPSLSLELNGLDATEAGCRFTFVIANGLGAPLDNAGFEIVLFDKAGLVSRLVTLDFKELPDGKTKVRQFDLPGVDCAGLGRVLVNDATECSGAGIDAGACISKLKASTKAGVEFGS